jgi:hypothetical protein
VIGGLFTRCWKRWSNRQETRMKLGEFMGKIDYEGDFGPFLPYIRLEEYIHVTLDTTLGLEEL